MTAKEMFPRRGWLLSLLIAALAAVFLGLPTGLTLLVVLESNSVTFGFLVVPAILGALVLAALRYWRPLPPGTRSDRRRRGLIVAGSVAMLLALDALVLFGVVEPRGLAVTLGVIKPGGGCTWEYSAEVAANTELAPGLPLTDDGKGAYSDAVDHVDTFIKHRLMLKMSDQLWPPKTTARRLVVDLSQPVPGSGSAPLGVLPTGISFGSFWYQDSNHMVRTVHAIPRDTTVPSDRTDIVLSIAGREHRLTMGRWSGAYCERLDIGGAGTSQATITRSGQEDYSVDAPAGSIARLWDMSRRKPVDKGLYYVGLRAHFRGK